MKTILSSSSRLALAAALLSFGLASRLFPHPPSMTMVTAVIVASSIYLGLRPAVGITLLLLLVSDLLIGGYELPVMASVYVSFLLSAGIGALIARTRSVSHRALLLACSSLLFFLITNAAVWYFTPWYAKDMAGLMASYALGLPFLKNMLIGDFLYTPALLAGIAYVLRQPRAEALPAYAV
jgi:hypothetical protein